MSRTPPKAQLNDSLAGPGGSAEPWTSSTTARPSSRSTTATRLTGPATTLASWPTVGRNRLTSALSAPGAPAAVRVRRMVEVERPLQAACMDDTQQQRSALVFGARNLGRAVSSACAPTAGPSPRSRARRRPWRPPRRRADSPSRGDITDPDSVRAPGRPPRPTAGWTCLNAASAYGGVATAPSAEAPGRRRPPRRSTRGPPPGPGRVPFLSREPLALVEGRPATLIQVTGGSARRAMPGRGLWAAGLRRPRDHQRRRAGAARARHPRRPADRRRGHRAVRGWRPRGRRSRRAGRPARDRRRRRLPGRAGRARHDPRAADHAAGRALGALERGWRCPTTSRRSPRCSRTRVSSRRKKRRTSSSPARRAMSSSSTRSSGVASRASHSPGSPGPSRSAAWRSASIPGSTFHAGRASRSRVAPRSACRRTAWPSISAPEQERSPRP